MNMIKEVRQLKRKVIPVSLEDLENSQQGILAQNVRNNTVRYVELFEDVVDDLLLTIPYTEEPTTPTDILNVGFASRVLMGRDIEKSAPKRRKEKSLIRTSRTT